MQKPFRHVAEQTVETAMYDPMIGGDVTSPFCHIRSHKFSKCSGLRLRPYSHYRLVLDGIGRDLTSFKTTKELVETLTGALQAHTEAYEKAQILHCDISIGNIIISDRGGLLIDWDLAKDINDLEKISRQQFRTGTWQFIAASLLQTRESAAHTPADDWESFFHVLSWVVLRFTRHGLSSAELTKELRNTYDDSYLDGGKVYGGGNKWMSIKSRYISSDAHVPPGPLLDLLKDLVDVCAVRYEDEPSEKEKKDYDLFPAQYHPFKLYYDRKKNLNASWILARFRAAVNTETWDLGPEGQRFENPLVKVDEVVIATKRQSEFETDMPQQSKRVKPTLDGGSSATVEYMSEADTDDVEEEDGECGSMLNSASTEDSGDDVEI